MSDLTQSEYNALRATIRARGSLRIGIVLGGLAAWGALAVAGAATALGGPASLIPLLILAATFEAVHALHVGVERIGRFLQVFYEELGSAHGPSESPSWETAAMAYGRAYPGSGPDPLFVTLFVLAALLNLAILFSSGPRRPLITLVAMAAHIVFLWRMLTAHRNAAGQRAMDLERFRKIKQEKPSARQENP